MSARIDACSIDVRYGPDVPLTLTAFSLRLRPGRLIGVVGPNGSGKSTLVRALSRTLRPVKGAVQLNAQDLYGDLSARDAAQTVAVVPQETSVSLDFTVREVVRMGRAPHLPRRPFASESPEDEQSVDDALCLVGILELESRLVPSLSGGERQRVLLARALAQQPEILLLDEPTAHLDLWHQTEILALVQGLARQGRAVLAVMHDLNLAASFCDEIVLMHGGRIAAQGTPQDTLTAANLEAVYGAAVWVRRHPLTGRPLILTLPDVPKASAPAKGAVHLICGGGTGAALMLALRCQGYVVTLAGLNAGDPDADAAEALGIPYAAEAPFSRLSPQALKEAARLAEPAAAVVLSPVPWGKANLGNLEAALTLRRAGKPLLCLGPFRDFTGGSALRLRQALSEAGAELVPDTNTLLASLEGILNGSRD